MNSRKISTGSTEKVASRNLPMRVLVLGLGRTGTTSLAEALAELGYSPYDFPDRSRLRHLQLWDKALLAKYYGKGKPWQRADFDAVTANFDAVVDTPLCFFAPELVAAYPDAKVILNHRDPDQWLASMRRTIFAVPKLLSVRILRYTDPAVTGVYMRDHFLTWEIFCGNDYGDRCREAFLKHYEEVRGVVPKERLLEWSVQDGWDPLWEFLRPEGVQKPTTPFPSVNDTEQMKQHFFNHWRGALSRSFLNVFKVLSVIIILAMMVRWVWDRR